MTPLSKKTLRENALSLRQKIPLDERSRAARAVCARFMAEVKIKPQAVVAGYWPVRGELDVIPLLNALIHHGHRCCLPHVIDYKTPLIFRRWHEGVLMTEGRFGIHQPDPETCEPLVPDVILTPLLGFDFRGHRLGYGSGFYDRSFGHLRDLAHQCLAIGIAFEAQQFEEVPADLYDVPMDYIVTEKTVHRFGGRA